MKNAKYPKEFKVYEYPKTREGQRINTRPIYLYSVTIRDAELEREFLDSFEDAREVAEVCRKTVACDYVRLFDFLAWYEDKVGGPKIGQQTFQRLQRKFTPNAEVASPGCLGVVNNSHIS